MRAVRTCWGIHEWTHNRQTVRHKTEDTTGARQGGKEREEKQASERAIIDVWRFLVTGKEGTCVCGHSTAFIIHFS